MKKLITFLPLLVLHQLSPAQDGKLSIIVMHQHALSKMYRTESGEPLSRICHPSPYCKRVPAKIRKDEDILKFTLEAIEKFNIVKAVISDQDLETVYAWKNKAPDIFLAGIVISHPITTDIDLIRKEIKNGNIKILGEILTQYSGLFPDDPVLAPYFDLAEELDIPVQIHATGSGGPSSTFSIQGGNPLHLENVLRNRPGLRIYLENAGWPFTAEMAALMYRYPNVYAMKKQLLSASCLILSITINADDGKLPIIDNHLHAFTSLRPTAADSSYFPLCLHLPSTNEELSEKSLTLPGPFIRYSSGWQVTCIKAGNRTTFNY